jgi:hypothetical protein
MSKKIAEKGRHANCDATNWRFEFNETSPIDDKLGLTKPATILEFATALDLVKYMSNEEVADRSANHRRSR